MNFAHLKYSNAGLIPRRSFRKLISTKTMEAFKNMFFADSKIFCCLGAGRKLVILDEVKLSLERIVEDQEGYSVAWADADFVLFKHKNRTADLIERNGYTSKAVVNV